MKANKNPAPRGNAESRAKGFQSLNPHSTLPAISETDYAVCYVASRYRLAAPIARAVVALAGLGRAFV